MLFNNFLIREAKPVEFDTINHLVSQNNETVFLSDLPTHEYVNRVRNNFRYVPNLELVAEKEGDIVGHVIFSKADLMASNGNKYPVLFVDPLSVRRVNRHPGVGHALVNNGAEMAKGMGFKAIFLYGNLDYFHNLGFSQASRWNIVHEGLDADSFLVKEIERHSLSEISGSLLV